jgi:hypothetical protein
MPSAASIEATSRMSGYDGTRDVYLIPETSDATADLKTGDRVQICALSPTDESEHYSLSLPGGIDGHTAQRVR